MNATNGVLANDTDADGDDLTAVLVTAPSSGTVTLNANGSFSYVPAAGFAGTVTFTYQADDGTARSGAATVTITVNRRQRCADGAARQLYDGRGHAAHRRRPRRARQRHGSRTATR